MDPTPTAKDAKGAVWMVEGYLSASSPEGLAALVDRLQEQLRAHKVDGGIVRLLHHVALPEDEMYVLLLEGPSAEAVEGLSTRAGFTPDRVTRAVPDPSGRKADPQ